LANGGHRETLQSVIYIVSAGDILSHGKKTPPHPRTGDAAQAPSLGASYDQLCAALREVLDQGALEKTVAAGMPAPLFTLCDTTGRPQALEHLLRKGHVVVTFFRGLWCSRSIDDSRQLDALGPAFAKRNAQAIAVSQQTAHYSRKTRQANQLHFPVLIDANGAVARAYGVQWTIPAPLRAAMLACGNDIPSFHGERSWSLPMAARNVIGRDGIISFAEVAADPQRRSSPYDLLGILDRLNEV
jgi:peroxiredoxin